jgi:hypothetical protein
MKNLLKHQEGITFLGILVIFAMLGCFFLFGLRAFPLYTEHFAIKQAMKGVVSQPYKSRNSLSRVRSLLLKNLDVNSVYTFNQKNIKKVATVKKKKGKKILYFKHTKSEHLFGDLYLTLKTDESIELPGGKEQ